MYFDQVKKFKDLSNEIIIGVDHEMYKHTVMLTENNKKEYLARTIKLLREC